MSNNDCQTIETIANCNNSVWLSFTSSNVFVSSNVSSWFVYGIFEPYTHAYINNGLGNYFIKVDFSVKVSCTDSDLSSSDFDFGIDPTVIGDYINGTDSNWTYSTSTICTDNLSPCSWIRIDSDGTVNTGSYEYSGVFLADTTNCKIRFARLYNTSESYGQWSISTFPNDCIIIGTFCIIMNYSGDSNYV